MRGSTTGTAGMVTVGRYLTERLHQVGVTDVFGVPGDYNLALLDQILADDRMSFIGCCNELDAGYAADGYARARGIGAVVTTFSVGGLSALNAIAGAHAEGLPVVLVSGGPNTRSRHEHEALHHTIDTHDYGYQRAIFEQVTASAVVIDHLEDAAAKIDQALSAALEQRRPAYIEIAANLAGLEIPAPEPRHFGPRPGDPTAVEAAVAALVERLDASLKPVVLLGAQARRWTSTAAVVALADALGCAVASMPDAKGLFSEDHPGHIGTYWGPISDPGVAPIVEAADLVLAVGPVFTDYTTAGHSCLLAPEKLAVVGADRVESAGRTFSAVPMEGVLAGLTRCVRQNATSLEVFTSHRRARATAPTGGPDPSEPLTAAVVADRVEGMLDATTTLVAETGDSWFHAVGMALPPGADLQIQMKYGSIGWSVGAALGLATADPNRKVVAMVGDGSFQMTAQELSTMLRHELPVTVFVINNGGYTIEVEIHDGAYNVIQDWRYHSLVEVFTAGGGPGQGMRATTVGELDDAIGRAVAAGGVNLIEVVIDRDDCSAELLEWGSRVAANNARPPHDVVVL